MDFNGYMEMAIEEAEISLRGGNNGFGAVIVHNGEVIARTHDTEDTDKDATSHAEINAIKAASKLLGKDLGSCVLVATHEPCPMCSAASMWAHIGAIAYGYSIKDAISQGRKRIDMPCAEIFERAGVDIKIYTGILQNRCSMLYNRAVRAETEKLRDADDIKLSELNAASSENRVRWVKDNFESFDFISEDILSSAYELLLARLKIGRDEAPVVRKTDKSVTFHSMNFCPTLEACRILGLDTRHVCKKLNEKATEDMIRQIDKRLKFTRNYECLRPYADYCEETIFIE